MKPIEVTGRNIDEIRTEAAKQLGVPEDQVKLEVVEEKRALLGFLGGGMVALASVADADADDAPADEPPPEADVSPDEPADETSDEAEPPADEDALARLANRAETVANKVLGLMGVAVEARASAMGDEEITLDLTGDDLALIIGKHGDTLDALQLLVAIITNRGSDTTARIVLDAEDYRDRRERSLEATALSHAAKAKQTDREVVIRDLKAYERRIIHLTLRDDPEIETYSEGEGRQRNLVISPTPAARETSDDEGADDSDGEGADDSGGADL